MKILITGATGYIGHKLATEAAGRNHSVHILVRNPHSPHTPSHPMITLFPGDITDKEAVMNAMKGCTHVLHAAGMAKLSVKDRSQMYKVNVEGTRVMLESALELDVKKFVFTSSCAVIGPSEKFPMSEQDPRIIAFENDYEISKHWAEELVKQYSSKGLFSVIVSPPRVYGPGKEVNGNTMNILLKNILSMKMAFMPSYDHVLANYAYVNDVVEGHFLAMEKGLNGEKYILGGENISYRRLFNTIIENADRNIRLVIIPAFLLKFFSIVYLGFCRLMGKETHISPAVVSRLAQNRALNCDKAIRELGFSITPFEEGIKQTILHLKNNYNES